MNSTKCVTLALGWLFPPTLQLYIVQMREQDIGQYIINTILSLIKSVATIYVPTKSTNKIVVNCTRFEKCTVTSKSLGGHWPTPNQLSPNATGRATTSSSLSSPTLLYNSLCTHISFIGYEMIRPGDRSRPQFCNRCLRSSKTMALSTFQWGARSQDFVSTRINCIADTPAA